MTPTVVPPAAASVLEEGRQAYVAVRSKHGPHVTPELYAWSDGRLWFAFAASTVKAKVLARDAGASALVTVAGRSVVLRGDVDLVDPRSPGDLVRQVTRLPDTALALGRFTVRNAPDLVAFVSDTASGRLGWRPPPVRVLGALAPTSVMVIEGDVVTHETGRGDQPVADPSPTAAGDTSAGGTPAVVGLPDVVAVPARWYPDEQRLHVLPAVLDRVLRSDRFPLGIVTDEYVAPGPAAKRGTLLRGRGRRLRTPGDIVVDVEQAIDWDGVATTRTTFDR